MINIYTFHHCPSILATPRFQPTTSRSQSGDANHSAIPPPKWLSPKFKGRLSPKLCICCQQIRESVFTDYTDYSVFTEYELGFNRVRVTSVAYVGQHLVNTEHCRVPSMTRIESLPVIEVMHLKSVLASEVTVGFDDVLFVIVSPLKPASVKVVRM